MADTIRTKAQYMALLADNTSQAISPQDHRDAVESQHVYGGMAVQNAGGAITQAFTSTPTKATFWNVDLPSNGVVPDSTTDNDLTIPANGDGDYMFGITCSFSVSNTSAASAQFRLRVNAVETGDGFFRSITATTVGSAADGGIITLAAGDVVTIYVESGSASSYNLQLYDAKLWLKRIA